ncbi:hypothetical protein PIB30_054914 [Stylosanthes scabra]|uniref:Uncharacterized protein n=1 Tax=Stylosanthes scabra TaxID=79078 RepID=A0ABU6UHN9_9FABA|nr:hypothetical protein [Stylosanthes scabra]
MVALLIKQLLEKGYAVNATVKDPIFSCSSPNWTPLYAWYSPSTDWLILIKFVDNCSRVVKNGVEIPIQSDLGYSRSKASNPLFECGPFCKCPPTCYNRVSQQIRHSEQGVRSLNSTSLQGVYLWHRRVSRTDNDECLF